ncbi:Protein of unknown function [Microbulbifer donghaiensis]|uniref:DUF1631 domain-containing protein n=1 Tax=Microbulbifer donghaiensis TaxID=494016 RepID=A0A1M5I5L6_9GAMM|nr:DUF1631 domain-containing protein [Microbulbifer donghaiensis]SHG23575.1 Protein of unknown function [Microbulbifer donghaiensis]
MDTNEFSRVVAFTNNKSDAAKRSSNRSLPAAVVSVRDTASSWLFARVKEVFTAVDDTLFSAAEKVLNQEEQDGLFQALRVLRLERNRVTDRFITAVQQGFVDIDSRGGAALDAGVPSEEGLSLVQNDDLEQLVALKSIIADVKRDCASPIAELALRLDTLMPVKVYDENMPLSPAVLCRAFAEALKPLDIHLRARLTVLKKFEQQLAAKLASLYQNCNQLLIDKGVLPGLKDPLLQRRQGTRPGAPAMPAGAGVGASAPQTGTPIPPAPQGFANAASGFAGGVMPSGAGAPIVPSMPGGYAGTAGGQVPTDGGAVSGGVSGGYGLVPAAPGIVPLATPDLLQHLGALQSVPLQATTFGQVLDVSSLLQDRLVEAKKSASLHELDTEVIRMVDLLFSFMLEDRNLAEPIKVQLIRLQLPLLKLAVADKAFFSKGGHPARKLFNALADAAIGWQPRDDYEKEPFYRQICSVVEQVLKDFDSDEGIFSRLLHSFEEFVVRERRRAEVMERRTVDEAQGSARVDAAKARVAAVFDALTAERKLPRIAHEWLNRVWNSVLFRTCLKEGTDSTSWRRNVLTARDLVWSVVAPMPESRFKMQQLLPGLRKRLDEGAKSLSLSVGDRQRLIQALNTLYRERQALGERVESERERRTRERLVQELLREADSVLEIPEVPGVAEPAAETYTAPAAEVPVIEAVAELSNADEPQTSELLDQETDLPAVEELQQVAEMAPVAKTENLQPLADSDECWQQTYHLKYSWFMLHAPDKPSVRCRLAAIIRELDQFMFVNRSGAKVAVYSRLELAHALRDDVITPLDNGPLFERALKHVVGAIGEVKVAVSVAEKEPVA